MKDRLIVGNSISLGNLNVSNSIFYLLCFNPVAILDSMLKASLFISKLW